MIETTTFLWRSVEKVCYTAEEFRVGLEKKKMDGKVCYNGHKKYSRDSALREYFPLHPEKSLVIAELVPDFPGLVKFYLGLIETCVVGLVSHADVSPLSWAGARDEPPRTSAWETIVGFASSCIIRGVNSSLFIYFKTIQACNDCERFGIEGKQSTVDIPETSILELK